MRGAKRSGRHVKAAERLDGDRNALPIVIGIVTAGDDDDRAVGGSSIVPFCRGAPQRHQKRRAGDSRRPVSVEERTPDFSSEVPTAA